MQKALKLLFLGMMIMFILPKFVFADESTSGSPDSNTPSGVAVGSEEYELNVEGFYWGTTVTTPNFQSSNSSFGGELNVRFLKDSALRNLGFGVEYTNTGTGPRFVNTGGANVTSFAGYTGFSVPINSVGGFGLVSPGNWQFGGGKVKYFIPTDSQEFKIAPYVDYFSSTGGRNAWGGGLELDYAFSKNWSLNTFWDYNNVTGNAFPSQNLLRYEGYVAYEFPNSHVNVLAGYRGYSYGGFYNTTINGYMIGLGGHF